MASCSTFTFTRSSRAAVPATAYPITYEVKQCGGTDCSTDEAAVAVGIAVPAAAPTASLLLIAPTERRAEGHASFGSQQIEKHSSCSAGAYQ